MLHPVLKNYIEVDFIDLSEDIRQVVMESTPNGVVNNDSYYVFEDLPAVENLGNWEAFCAHAAKSFDIPLKELFIEDWTHYPLVKEVYDVAPELFNRHADGILVKVCW